MNGVVCAGTNRLRCNFKTAVAQAVYRVQYNAIGYYHQTCAISHMVYQNNQVKFSYIAHAYIK